MSKIEIKVPSAGESVSEATISRLIVKQGEQALIDQPIFEVETDKASMEIPAPAEGQVSWIVKEGDVVKIGQVIGTIDAQKSSTASAPLAVDSQTTTPVETKSDTKLDTKLEVKPVIAPENSGPQPSFPAAPVENGVRKPADLFLQETKPVAPPKEVTPVTHPLAEERTSRRKMSRLRRVISQKLVEVKNQTAMLTTFNEVDLSAIIAVRAKEQENFQKRHGVKLGFMSFFAKACVAALKEHPDINARIEGDEIVRCNYFDIGIAVGTDKGLMVPVLRNVDQLSYADIEKGLKQFAEKARAGTLAIDDMQGGTFTITNGGTYGSLLSTPILNPPQSGILGMHNIVKRPIAMDDQVVIRPMMYIALSYDHRIVDGKESIEFLVHMKKNLEDPTRLLLGL